MYNKRRPGRRGFPAKRNARPNYVPVILMLCLSVGCGYAAARYIVEPVVNYVPQITAENEEKTEEPEQKRESGVIEDEADVEEKGDIEGYALQFGCYSEEASAEKAMADTGMDGLQVISQDSMYKIIGDIYETKEEARNALEEVPEDVSAFVTTVYGQQ